jgi:hypothetical protein
VAAIMLAAIIPVYAQEHVSNSVSPVDQFSTSSLSTQLPWLRYAGWGVVGLFGAGGFGAYLRRRPTAFLVVAIWCFAAYHAYSSWRLEQSAVPPLLAIALTFLLGPVAKSANDEAMRTGKRRESNYKFTGSSSLTMAFNLISIGLIVSLLFGWHVWEIFPGFKEWPFSRRMVIGFMLLTGVPLMMWIDTLAHGGLRVLMTVPTMIVVFLRCRRGRKLMAIFLFCVCIWHWPFAVELSPLRWEMTFSLAVAVALLWLQPPYVLMLGASSTETGEALARLSNVVFPFRVVALLDSDRTGRHLGTFSWMTDDLRTVDERDWRILVDKLVERVPVIVLDARTERTVVVYEAEQLLHRPERLRRSTFVITDDGSAPALSLNGVLPSFPGLRVLRPDQIEIVLDFGGIASSA